MAPGVDERRRLLGRITGPRLAPVQLQAEVQRLAFDAVRRLRADGAKAVVIACNTATAEAAKELRAAFDLPIIGMEPALKPASELRQAGLRLVLATPGTLKSAKYAKTLF